MLILKKPWAIGILLLFIAEITEEFVVLSATLNDVRKLAKKFVSDDLAENIVNFIVQATMNMGNKVEQEGTLRHIVRKDPSISSGEPVLGDQKITEDQSGSSETSDSKSIEYIGQTRNVLRTVTADTSPDTTSSPTNKKLQAKLTKPTKSHRDPTIKDSSKEKLSQEDKNSKEKTKANKKHGKFNFKIHSKKTKQHHETTPKGSNEKEKRLSKEETKNSNRHIRFGKDSQTPSKTKHKSTPSKDSDHKDRANKEETKTKHSKRNKDTKRKKDKRNKQKHSKTPKKALRNREPNENEENKSKTNYHQLPMYKQKLEQLPNVPWLKPQNTKATKETKPSSDAMETKKERKVQEANATSSNESSGRVEKPTNLVNHKIKLSVKSDATKVNAMQTDVKKPGKRSQESSGSSSEGSSTADEGQGGKPKGIKSAKKPNKDESSSSGSSEPNSSPAPPIAVPKSVNLNGGQAFYARASVMETDAPSYKSEEDSSSYEDYRRSHKSKKSKKKTKTNSRSKKKNKDKTL